MTTPDEPTPVEVHTTKPPGVMPKNLQAYVVGGLALAMVVVIAFSVGNQPKTPAATPVRIAEALDPNLARIEEYRRLLDEDAKRLIQEQSRLAQGTAAPGDPGARTGAFPAHYDPASDYAEPERSWTELDREKREYNSRYASNVALSKRAERQGATTPAPAAQPAQPSASPNSTVALTENTYRLPSGTIIETALTNRLDSSFAGPVKALVTTDVYSQDKSKLLIPKGTFAIGAVAKTEAFNEERLAVSFSRLELPNGQAIDLEAMPGLSQMGETGLLDKVNRHYGRIFGVSLAIGAIAGLSQANTTYGPGTSASDVYRQSAATSLSQSSLNILDRFLNVVPTFTVREGTRIKVFLTSSLELPAYADSTPPTERRPS